METTGIVNCGNGDVPGFPSWTASPGKRTQHYPFPIENLVESIYSPTVMESINPLRPGRIPRTAMVAAALGTMLCPAAPALAADMQPGGDAFALAASLAVLFAVLAASIFARLRKVAKRHREAEASFETMADACGGMAFICSPEGRIEYMNAAMAKRVDGAQGDAPCHEALFGRDKPCPWCVNVGLFVDETARYEFQDPGDGRWYEAVNSSVPRADGTHSKLVMLRDVTRARKEARRVGQLEELHHIMGQFSHFMEIWIDENNVVRYVSPSCEQLTGHQCGDFLQGAESLLGLAHRDDSPLLADFLAERGEGNLDFRVFRRDGAMRWLNAVRHEARDTKGEPRGLRLSIRDITERKLLEIQLRYQALHDPLTGLANRVLASDRVAQAVERSKRRDDYHFAVAFADVDRLKVINDSFGHKVGDKVLEEIAQRLHKAVRQLDMVARYSSDQFVLLLEELDRPRKAVNIINRCRKALQDPVVVDGHEMNMTLCFGAVLFPPPEDDAEELVRKANIALHLAKEAGYGKLKVFVPHMLDRAVELMTFETDLRHAVANNEFFVQYQPILSLNDSTLKGFEALIRWQHPTRGVISPAEFIPLAEEAGFIVEIGRFVLEESCRTMSQWRQTLPEARELMLSVNLSVRQFNDPGLVESIRNILHNTGMPPDKLKLEVTETAIMDNAKSAVEKLNQLKELGIQISIDDFGTGYSSMSYLQKFPLDHLKIDLSFVKRMDTAPENRAIVKAIINLAHGLGLQVVAEGVEKTQHQDILASLDCEFGQGFLFSRPVGAGKARSFITGETMLLARRRRPRSSYGAPPRPAPSPPRHPPFFFFRQALRRGPFLASHGYRTTHNREQVSTCPV